jgi:hypothetical protein
MLVVTKNKFAHNYNAIILINAIKESTRNNIVQCFDGRENLRVELV